MPYMFGRIGAITMACTLVVGCGTPRWAQHAPAIPAHGETASAPLTNIDASREAPAAPRPDSSAGSDFATLARQSLAQIEGRVSLPGLLDSVEVVRDRWGVPHIYAANTHDLFFAQGYVHSQDRLWQMEIYRRMYEGTLAEIMGEEYVPHDRLMRLLRLRGPFDDAEWQSYHPEGRAIFQAFADGVNAFIEQTPEDRLPVEFRLTGLQPQPWTADIALLRTQTAMPIGDARNELTLAMRVAELGVEEANRRANPSPYRDLEVPAGLDVNAISADVLAALGGARTGIVRPELLPHYRAMADALPSENRGVQEDSPGSNNWAINGRLTESGNVIVANDPHRNVSNPSIRYIVHLNAPGWNVIGATEAPLPGVMIGHNGRLAWGLTIVGADQSDVYVEQVDPTYRNRVRFGDVWEPMDVRADTIRVKGAAPVVIELKRTRHGPVFHEDTVRNLAYAMRSTMHLPGTAGYLSALRYHGLDDCRQFLEAQVYYKAPTENMICGDVHGNIAWHASAAAPRRPNWFGRLPVPGTGEYEWDDLRDDLPYELNPERGWVATANHDIHPPDFDPPLFFKNGPSRGRQDRVESVLSSGRRFNMADMQALQHDAWSAQAAEDIPLFRGWASEDPSVERARQALAEWDAQHRRESEAAAVYRFVSGGLDGEVRAAGTPAARRQALLEGAITGGLDSLRTRLGDDPAQWRWGRLNVSELPHALVRAFDIPPVERHGGSGFVAAVGATFREIIDLGDLDASMVTNMPGQSAQPGSPFYSDLVESYGRGEYFPLVYSREAVEEAAAYRLILVPGASGDEPVEQRRRELEERVRNDWAQLSRYREANAAMGTPAAGEQRVVFMGNSITEAWAAHFGELFPGRPYVGRGISGQTTPQMLVRFRQDVLELQPSVVVILAGTNDIAGNTGPATPELIQGNIASMAELARAHGIRVVLSSVLPVFEYPWARGLEPASKIVALNEWIRAYADSTGAGYVDYHTAMRDERNGLRVEFSGDGVHPNFAGYRLMARLVEEEIMRVLGRDR